MRMSCNGCRVLRKGCSDNCSIRPCLQWIKNPESQANATVFLAKFYGRAGLMNLINAGPEHLRPAIFRSLLYESCGRIVNPIYGSVGLLWSGSWQMCQAAVEAVLKGAPIMQIPSETAANTSPPPLKAYDIRHVSKDETAAATGGSSELHKVAKATRTRFKRSSATSGNGQRPTVQGHVGGGSSVASPTDADNSVDEAAQFLWRRRCYPADCQREVSHESSAASHEEAAEGGRTGDSRDNGGSSVFSEETADASMVTAEKEKCFDGAVELELTLGLERPISHSRTSSGASPSMAKPRCDKPVECCDSDTRKVDLALDLTA